MSRFNLLVLSFVGLGLAAGLILPACNSIQPASPRQETSSTSSSGCNGVFGNNSAATIIGTIYGSYIFFYPIPVTSSKTLVGLSLYSTSTVPVTYEMGIYADTSGAPSTLLMQTGQQTSGPVTGWNTVTLPLDLPLSSGKTYWLALHSNNFQYQASTTSAPYALQPGISTYGSMPPVATPTPGTSNILFSAYGTTCP